MSGGEGKAQARTTREAAVRVKAARVVRYGEAGWAELLLLLGEAARDDDTWPLHQIARQATALQMAKEGDWIVWTPGNPLAVREEWWMEQYLPGAVAEPEARGGSGESEARCLLVWREVGGWHQCHKRFAPAHDHPECFGKRVLWLAEATVSGEAACLGIDEDHGLPHVQCSTKRSKCKAVHAFYGRTRVERGERS